MEAMQKQKVVETKTEDLGGRRVRFVISTGSTDREGDVIDPNGWDLSAYRRSPVVLWAHSHRDLPIAKCTDIGVRGDKLEAVAEFAPADMLPFAETVLQMLRGGFLSATSVGFRATKYAHVASGIHFMEQELLEFSVVPVPANAEALMVGRGANLAAVKSWLGRQPAAASEHVLTLDDEHVLHLDDEPAMDMADWVQCSGADDRNDARWALARAPRGARAAGLTELDVTPAQVRAAIAQTLPGIIREAVGDAVAAALRKARGRVD